MKRIGLSLLTAVVIFSGCAPKAVDVPAEYVPQSKYESWSCEELNQKLNEIEKQVAVYARKQDSAHNRDVAAGVVGAVLFWPALFVMAVPDDREQLAVLKGEYEAIDRSIVRKKCTLVYAMKRESNETAKRPD